MHIGYHLQRAPLNPDHSYEYSFVNGTKALPSFSDLTSKLFSDYKFIHRYRTAPYGHHSLTPPKKHRGILCQFDGVNRPYFARRSRSLTFEQVFNTNNYNNVVEVLDNRFHKLSRYSQTSNRGHHHDVGDSVGDEPEREGELSRPEVDLDHIELKKDQEWLKFVINLGKVDKKGPAIYQCLHHIEDKTDKSGQPTQSTCDYKGAKQTVKRHVNSVHFGRRPWVCDRCSSAFNQKSTLDIHINARHTQKKPHKCPHCSECFTDPAKRHKHCVKAHPDIPMLTRRKAPYKSVLSSSRQVETSLS